MSTITRDEFYARPVERIIRLRGCGGIVKLSTPAEVHALPDADREFVAELIELIATYERLPGAHRTNNRGATR